MSYRKASCIPGRQLMYALIVVIVFGLLTTSALADKFIINAMSDNDPNSDTPQNKVAIGVQSALAAPSTLLGGTHLLQNRVTASSSNIVGAVDSLVGADTICVVGPGSDEALTNLLDSTALADKQVVFIGPYTQTSTARQWNEQLYFTTPPPSAELLALFSYVVSNHRPSKVGFMYLAESGLGEEALALLSKQLTAQGLPPVLNYTHPVTEIDLDPATMQQFFDSRPQVVFIFGTTGTITTDFFKQAVQSQALIDSETVLACPFSLMDDLLRAYNELVTANVEPLIESSRILFSSPVPLVTDDRFPETTGAFLRALTTPATLPSTADKTLAFSGWVSAQVAYQAARRYAYGTRQEFAESIFQQNRYIIMDELIVGDYGGPCSSNTADVGAACSCNQGGHAVYVSTVEFTEDNVYDVVPIYSGNFYYGLDRCTPADIILFNPIYTLGVNVTNNPQLEYVYSQQVEIAMIIANKMDNKHKIAVTIATAEADGMQGKLDTIFAKTPQDVVIGPSPITVRNTYQAIVLDPVYQYTPLINTNAHTIYTCPTLDQELFLLIKHIKTRHESLSAVVVSSSSNAIDTPIERAIGEASKHFDVNVNDLHVVAPSDFSAAYLTDGVNIVTNLPVDAVIVVVDHLENNPHAVVALSFTDITSMYDLFKEAFGALSTSSTAAQRLIFATNLPPWMDNSNSMNAASPGWSFTNGFLTAVTNDALYTPAGMRGYLVAKFLEELSSDINVVNSQRLLENLYRRRFIIVDDVVLGPYSAPCDLNQNTNCGQNYGARDISVWPFSRCLDPSQPILQAGETPILPYRSPPGIIPGDASPGLDVWIIGLIVAIVVLLLLILLFLVIYFCWNRKHSRDNRNAPKDATKPVTVIFTDIESSTALWSAITCEMSKAVTAHHKMIRDLIIKYKCYEVKTIGDAFMIVTHDPNAAVQLAHELQSAFMNYNWGTDKIDIVYRDLERRSRLMRRSTAQTQRMTNEEYASCWKGLRVRVGIHTGMSDIRFDDVTKGYDYYGDTSNTAARTEALGCGGQIIATQFTWNALTQKQQDSFKVRPLGAQYLRGVANAIHMYEIIAVEQRSFPLLTTVPAEVKIDDIRTSILSSDEVLRQALREAPAFQEGSERPVDESVLDEEKEKAATNILDAYLGPYPNSKKRRMLEAACNQFSIQIPDRRCYATDDAHISAMVECVAARTAMIVDYRHQQEETMQQELAEAEKKAVEEQKKKNRPEMDSLFTFPNVDTIPSSPYSVGTRTTTTGSAIYMSSTIASPDHPRTLRHYGSHKSINTVKSPKDQSGVLLVMNGGGVLALSHDTNDDEDDRENNTSTTDSSLPDQPTMTDMGTSATNPLAPGRMTAPVTPMKLQVASPVANSNSSNDDLPSFVNGRPTILGDKVVKCFNDGLLYRITDSATNAWAYYNDTVKYHMFVDFSFGKNSSLRAAPGVEVKLNAETGRYEGTLEVPPVSTALIGEGPVNGYKLKYTARPIRNKKEEEMISL